jgi:deoxyribodipyrimidine photo-lyase
MIPSERIKRLNDMDMANRPYVLYWMQSAQRAECNHALEYAVRQANALHKPVIVVAMITEDFPEANERHYRFMLEGLRETQGTLAKRGIQMLIRKGSPEKDMLELSCVAALLVVDRGYLHIERAWRAYLAERATCPVIQVETNVIVPVETASPHEEYAARTLRPKIHRLLHAFTLPLVEQSPDQSSIGISMPWEGFAIDDIGTALARLNVDRTVKCVNSFVGGTSKAKTLLDDFIANKLQHYASFKNDPNLDYQSNLSPYLHFGQISPLYIYLCLAQVPEDIRSVFFEELIIRRELSMNFAHYNDHYDGYDSIPAWARTTLDKHRNDDRPYRYTRSELEEAKTHDRYWNAAQLEMVLAGKMNGYMRMYWGKKILEWSATSQEAYQTAVFLNNRYNLDGRDPNAFAGIAWCFGKHDRPWQERQIFGTIRYMNAAGLERKFDMQGYLHKVQLLAAKP